jgi:Fe-S-cluster containining protein
MEWDLLRHGLETLPAQQFLEISHNVATLANQLARHIVCPMLDQSAGACRIYEHRPVACRTYGFYVQRDLGLYCNEIKSEVERGGWVGVVWGNQDAIDRRLGGLGETKDLIEWFASIRINESI